MFSFWQKLKSNTVVLYTPLRENYKMPYTEGFATMHWYKKLFGILLVGLNISLLYVFVSIPLSTEKRVEATFLEALDGEYALIFFGFPNCGTACPVAMNQLRMIYEHEQARTEEQKLDVVFVNLLLEMNAQSSEQYAKSFHQDFHSYQLTRENYQEITRDFGVTFVTDVNKHSQYLYLLQQKNKRWQILKIFDTGYLKKSEILEFLET